MAWFIALRTLRRCLLVMVRAFAASSLRYRNAWGPATLSRWLQLHMGGVAWLPDAPRKPSALRVAVCLALFSSTYALSGPKPRQGDLHRHGWKWLSPSDEVRAGLKTCRFLSAWDASSLISPAATFDSTRLATKHRDRQIFAFYSMCSSATGHLEVLMTYDRPLVASWEKEAEVVRCAAGLSSMEARSRGHRRRCGEELGRFQVMPAKHWPILAPRWQQLINLYASNSYEQELAFNDSLVIAEHRFEYRRPGGDFPAPANAESAAGTVEFLLHHARGMTERLEAPRILLVELQCGWGYRAAALGHLLQSHLTLVAMEENDKLVEAARENCSRNSAPASVHRGGVHDLQYLLQNGSVPHALIASSSRSAGLGEDLYSYISQIQVRELLYISAGRMSSQQDLPKLQKLGFEVRSLQVVDPMPGTDHVEIRAHLRRDDATDFVGPAVLTQGLGSACWSKCEWLCGSCENLVFRRHIRQCPRCGALRDLEAAARLQQKAELSTVIKAVQKDPDLREKWLKHCKAAELSKNPMLNRHSSNHAFLIENVDSSSLAPYQGVLRKHGIVLSSEVVVESEELPYANASRSSPRKLLIVSAKRGDWALQVAAEVSQSLRTRSSNSMFPQTAYPSQWIWASFDKKSQGPPKINQDAPQWQWVDIKNGDNILGTQCEVVAKTERSVAEVFFWAREGLTLLKWTILSDGEVSDDSHGPRCRLQARPPAAESTDVRTIRLETSLDLGLGGIDLVMVDEAAAQPTSAMERFFEAAHAMQNLGVVVAGTVHGYEGTGHGLLRALERAELKGMPLARLKMETPIRWPLGDPVEKLVADALLLDPEPLPLPSVAVDAETDVEIERIRRQSLVSSEEIIREVYGLLAVAHYRTRPADLRLLLDETRMELFAIWTPCGGHRRLLACALLLHEQRGGLRRHDLLAEALLPAGQAHERASCISAAFLRVVRLAVHPEVQGKGLGHKLLGGIIRDLSARGDGRADVLGAIFNSNPRLLNFWTSAGFARVPDAEQENTEQLKEYEAQKFIFTRASSLTMFPTKKGVNISSENSPFAKVRTKMVPVQPHNTFATAVDVEIATPEIIVSVYLLLYVPLAMAWAYFAHYGYQEKHYLILVPFTLCAFTVGSDLVNQSLSTLTAAPMALTTIQAGFCFVITALWTLGCQVYASFAGRVSQAQDQSSKVPSELSLYPLSCGSLSYPLLRWTPAALWFVAYQLINHEVSLYCSLSERTIFLNLCPLFALFIEPLVLPSNISRGFNVTFSSKMALITMAFGALLFSLQYPEFSANGARAAGLLVAVVLPYRLLQRMLLAECKEAPATLLCAFDGLLLTLPAGVLTTVNERFFLEAWNVWLHNPSIMLMLALSVFAFVGNHLAVLYLLKATSATSTLVFSNLSNFIVVFEGIVFFSDPVLQAPLVMAGIIFSLFGGVWYAVEQQESRKSFQVANNLHARGASWMPDPDVLSLLVAGAGCEDVNGVYELEGSLCEGCPVYGNLSDFSLSVCQGPAADTGELQWGWILGRSGVPAYGCPTDTKEEVPLQGWQPFECDEPAPTLRWLTSADAMAEGYAQEARRRAASGTIENQRLAVKAFRQSLQTVTKQQADRTQRALLHTELAALLRTSSREDQALKEVEAALQLRHGLPEALLLKAHLLNAASNEGAAALAAKQCWIQIETVDQKADSNTRRLLRECKELLKELGEACDGLLPKAWPVSVCAAEAPKMLHGGVMDFCIEAVELQGSSVAESDGVYEPSRKVSNGFPVFENRFGFQLSMEVQATKAGDVSAGWIVGRKNVGFFGTRQLLSNQFPSNDWHCFPAASKESAPTECSVKTTQLEENLGWSHWARLGNYGGPAEAARILPACVNRLGRGGDVRRAAWALTELAGALRQLGQFADASVAARKALATCPSLPQAYLELACCLQHQGQKDEAADILQSLLAQQPNDGRAKEALRSLGFDLSCPRDIPCEVPTDETTQRAKASKSPDISDFTLEDQKTEVHAHWVLGPLRKAKDILVRFQEQRLLVAVGEDTLFDDELAHRIRPSDSSWTFATPDLTVTLCKRSEEGRWPRWEVLHKEDPTERLQRLGGLPFDAKAIHWI
eukprot:s8_g22.t2